LVIEQVGHQPMRLAVTRALRIIQSVFDHPHDDAIAILVTVEGDG
jgi:hypothetical protein